MVMKFIQISYIVNKSLSRLTFIIYINRKEKEGGIHMLKLLAKMAENMAKSTNTACFVWGFLHQPKMPKSMIKKD